MRDLVYLAIFLACGAATWALGVLCDRLMPADTTEAKP